MTGWRRRAILLDRDGTLIPDEHYPADPDLVRLYPGAAEALRTLVDRGFTLVVISNQSGVGRGLVTTRQAAAVHERLVEVLAEEGVYFAGAYYCFHAPEDMCGCRKPQPGLLLRAAEELDLDLKESVLVGDRASDVEAGRSAGCRTVLLQPASWHELPGLIEGLFSAE